MMGQLDVLPVQQQWAERDKRKKRTLHRSHIMTSPTREGRQTP